MSIENEEERKSDFEARKGEEIMESLLVSLQEKQEDEEAMILGNIKHKGIGEVQGMCEKHKRSLVEGWYDNVSAVLFAKQVAETEGEDEVVKELEKKYDAMKDRLILQMLEKQMGEEEWMRLSERERQKKMMQMKIRDRQLRAAGREDEADEMYKAMVNVQKTQADKAEENKKKMKERIKARLDFKRQRLAEGASKEEIDKEMEEMKKKDDLMDAANIEAVSAKDILSRLTQDFDKEKDALLDQIRYGDGKLKSEKERQLAVLRLKRQQIRFADAKARQLYLAKQRIAARKQKLKDATSATSGDTEEEDDEEGELEDVSTTEDTGAALQDSIIQLLDRKHSAERDLLINISNKIASYEVG
eukprot:sb/3466042/